MFQNIFDFINFSLDERSPLELILATVIATQVLRLVLYLLEQDNRRSLFDLAVKLVTSLPWLQQKISEEVSSVASELEESVRSQFKGRKYWRKLPERGVGGDEILAEVEANVETGAFDWKKGGLSGTIHLPHLRQDEIVDLVTKVYGKTAWSNQLNPDAFPGIQKMEAEVVSMTLDLFDGSEGGCGTMTSGGSESLILACKAYRDHARASRGIRNSTIVMPQSGHVAFFKAAHLLGMRVVTVPLVDGLMTPDMVAYERAITGDCAVLVGSAPQYPHGILDPIMEIGLLGERHGIPVHVDACLGGFLLPFMKKLNLLNYSIDFNLPGITSISADTHKFGCAPKGSSVIMYRENKFLHHQYFVEPDWSGGIFISPTMAGSRSGGLVAACWASMMHFGLEGYAEACREITRNVKAIKEEVGLMEHLDVVGDPKVCIIAFDSKHFDVYRVGDGMKELGWNFQYLQKPHFIHFYITPLHIQSNFTTRFINDLKVVVKEIMKDPKKKLSGRSAIYGMTQSIPDKAIVENLACRFLDSLYKTK